MTRGLSKNKPAIESAGLKRVSARFLNSIADIDASSWNALAGSAQPFLRHEFLLALEKSGCVTARTGWGANHLIVEDDSGVALAAMGETHHLAKAGVSAAPHIAHGISTNFHVNLNGVRSADTQRAAEIVQRASVYRLAERRPSRDI